MTKIRVSGYILDSIESFCKVKYKETPPSPVKTKQLLRKYATDILQELCLENKINNLYLAHGMEGLSCSVDLDNIKKKKVKVFVGDCDAPLRYPYEEIIRHELYHVADAVNKEFAYNKEREPTEQKSYTPYMLIWNIYIDSRITRKGKEAVWTKRKRLADFKKVFTKIFAG